ncbi:uncharacterized protein LOC124941205 [Impatiens glandulifera]|uniref:uncharacterized protein LOC124941205 n=1 Tax=Impatiens glandulifera TaxID=253017 RepID=UPI001FB10E3A|nr:uncharacterized protein LOC124941205 [Impatiens glandulifera]XP_047337448.1 uncharacterized protein LOC124941205 [Impatiens glandulifera]
MNILKKNVEKTSKRRKRPASQYQETNLMKHAKEAYDWSEEELDSLWIGIRRYGQSGWEAMLNDSMLKFSNFRTPTSLSERWILEQQKFQWDFFQVSQLAVQTRSEAAINNDFTKIQMKVATSSSRSKRKVAVIGHARYRKLVIKETTEDQDNITDMENSNDSSDSELSFKGWIKGNEVSSEEIVSG